MISVDDKESCAACVSAALATIVRGKLCDKLLSNRIPVTFEKDDILYDLGDGDHTFFFLQSGVVKVGTMTFQFTSGNAGTLNYTVNGISVTKAIQREVFSTPTTQCQ